MSPDRPRWLSLPELRTRRSYKWRAYPADVLPTFVAEMDVSLAEPVTRVLQEAIAAGDTGYATPDPELAAAVASFHLARFGWQLDPAGVHLIPDVMTGVTEVLRSAVPSGSGVVGQHAGVPALLRPHRERGVPGAGGPSRPRRRWIRAGPRRARGGRGRGSPRLPPLQSPQPDRAGAHRGRASPGRRAGRASSRSWCSPTRSMRR